MYRVYLYVGGVIQDVRTFMTISTAQMWARNQSHRGRVTMQIIPIN